MHLSRLDNEVFFKKAFTDKLVFTQFVKDVIGINIKVGKIETEKRFKPKIAYIDFAYDIFTESKDSRIIIEIQRVNYDYIAFPDLAKDNYPDVETRDLASLQIPHHS